MARIRTIKPEFFTSEDIVSLTPLARIFYISLWCESDREGRLQWKPKTLKMRYLPGDNCDIDSLANELIDNDLIIVYEDCGKLYAEIPSFKNHQVINNRESDSVIPARVGDASARVKAEGRKEGMEGKGREGKAEPIASDDASDAELRSTPQCPHQEILALWAEKLPSAIQPREWTPARSQALKTRWREKPSRQNLVWWSRFFEHVGKSDFLMGRSSSGNRRPFDLSIDWLLKQENFVKVIEGRYHGASGEEGQA